jgi:sugar-phosphatase
MVIGVGDKINKNFAAIFDLDGLLIDSEHYWQEAELEILTQLGVPLTREMCFQTVGFRIEEAVAYWYERYPWPDADLKEVSEDIVGLVIDLIEERGQPMPGAINALKICHRRDIPVGIATSTRKLLAHVSIDKLGIAGYIRAISSAEEKAYGKPHPVVYLEAARMLNAAPENCLVFEDSINGVISAKAARMKVIAVPYPPWREDPRFVLADEVLYSLKEFDVKMLKAYQQRDSQNIH